MKIDFSEIFSSCYSRNVCHDSKKEKNMKISISPLKFLAFIEKCTKQHSALNLFSYQSSRGGEWIGIFEIATICLDSHVFFSF